MLSISKLPHWLHRPVGPGLAYLAATGMLLALIGGFSGFTWYLIAFCLLLGLVGPQAWLYSSLAAGAAKPTGDDASRCDMLWHARLARMSAYFLAAGGFTGALWALLGNPYLVLLAAVCLVIAIAISTFATVVVVGQRSP